MGCTLNRTEIKVQIRAGFIGHVSRQLLISTNSGTNSSHFLYARLAFILIIQLSDLGQVQNKNSCGEQTHALPFFRRLFSLLRRLERWKFVFCVVNICLKGTIFKRESEQYIYIYYIGDLLLQLSSSDLHLEYSKGTRFLNLANIRNSSSFNYNSSSWLIYFKLL